MKVALCTIGRFENRYILEFVNYYKRIGIDKIFLYDNNHDYEEKFEDVISDYIDSGFVEIINYRNKENCQNTAYQDCYDKHNLEYDWICFFDIDEFLIFRDTSMNVKSFLSNDVFNSYQMIHINWLLFDDNNLVYYESKPVLHRFTKPKTPIDFKAYYNFPENFHIKSIVRGGNKIKWMSVHTPCGLPNCCNVSGIPCNQNSPFNKYDYSVAWLNHYRTKTIEEWLSIKALRGYCDGVGNNDVFRKRDSLDDFFKLNDITDEKLHYIKQYYSFAESFIRNSKKHIKLE